MKKVINVKEIMIILVSVILITVCTTTYATGGLVLNSATDNGTLIPSDDYNQAQTVPEDNNTLISDNSNNTTNNTANNVSNNKSNNTNTVKTYNTSNKTDLPQTGIEDYNVGILLIICVASAIFAYKKVSDYRNI